MAHKNHVAVRLDDATLDKIDGLMDRFATEWRKPSKSDVLRALILRGITSYEAEAAEMTS